jgi:hypothetical protein
MFRKLTLGVLAVATLATFPALAQVGPATGGGGRSPVARIFPDQQVAYVRTTFAFNSCVQAANVCTVKLLNASLPYNSAVLRVTAVVHTAFNSTTTDVITLGTTAANANEISSAGCSTHAQGLVACTVLATASSATGAGATQTGVNGGFDLFLKWTGGGGSPTTGLMALVIEYIMPNDGLCTTVGAGATAIGC